MKRAYFFFRYTFAWVLFASFLAIGCDSNSSDDSDNEANTEDAASVAALAVSEDDGGVADQLTDVIAITENVALDKSAAGSPPVYDPATQTWTVNISRDRSSPSGQYSRTFARTYTYQFLDSAGQPQQFYNTNGALAQTILFDIVNGTGSFMSPTFENTLNSLTADWTLTREGTNTFLITGTYSRSASSVIDRLLNNRSVDYDLTFSSIDLEVDRDGTMRDYSGTLIGTYDAVIETAAGRTIEKTYAVQITLTNGNATIELDGERYVGSLETGELSL